MGFPSSPNDIESTSLEMLDNTNGYVRRIALLSVLLLGSSCFAKFEGKQSDWKGYTKTEFQVVGNNAFVVEPKKPAVGTPWVWRARFPTYHTEIDEMLLKDGYHIAHINTGPRLGSIHALKIWEQFYDLLTQKHG
ncbi:MAG: hypothetical protein VW576_09830, partial [Opitutae bacterium]